MPDEAHPRSSACIRGPHSSARKLQHAGLTDLILGTFYQVYNELGHGFLESVYEEAFAIALVAVGLRTERQTPLTVWFRGQAVGAFRPDFVVEDAVIVELKAARVLESAHEAQLLNYLRASDIEVGLLLSFGVEPSFKRLVYHNSRKLGRG